MRSYIRLINKKDLHDLDIYDIGEEALRHIVNGNEKEAARLLRNEEKEKGNLLSMKLCYLGKMALKKSVIIRTVNREVLLVKDANFIADYLKKILEEFDKYGIIYKGDAK